LKKRRLKLKMKKGDLMKGRQCLKRTAVILLMFTLLASASLPVWAQTNLTITGATTIQSVAEKMAVLYENLYGASVTVMGGGSATGLRDVVSGTSHVGMVSRGLTDLEQESVDHVTIGYDALVFIVNERNPLTGITKEEAIGIYQGDITHWDTLANWHQPITLVTKEQGRATLDLFEGYSDLAHPEASPGPRGNITPASYEIGSNLECITLTGGIPGAIGYVSLGSAISLQEAGMPVKILELDGIEPSHATIVNGTYPILRELNLVYAQDDEKVEAYLDLILGPEGQQAVAEEQFVPVR